MHGTRHGSRAMMRLVMVVGIVAALGMGGAAVASPARCSCGGGASPLAMSATATQHTLDTYWAMLDVGSSPAQVLTDDAVLTYEDMGQEFQGRAAVTDALHNLYHVAFAGRMTIDDRIVGSGWGATSGMFVGTQIGAFDGMAATGKSMAVPYTAVYTLVDGRIATIRLDFSQQDILNQLTGTTIPWSSTQARHGIPF